MGRSSSPDKGLCFISLGMVVNLQCLSLPRLYRSVAVMSLGRVIGMDLSSISSKGLGLEVLLITSYYVRTWR